MAEPLDLTVADHIKADAVGEPGKRMFRIRVVSPSGAAQLWMEKEQLHALAMAIDQLLAQLQSSKLGRVQPAIPSSESGDFPNRFTIEFRVGRLGLGYDDERDMLVLLAHDQESDPEGSPTATVRASRGQMKTVSAEIGAAMTAGRPRCPLCNTPIVPGTHHACPGTNGKTPHPVNE